MEGHPLRGMASHYQISWKQALSKLSQGSLGWKGKSAIKFVLIGIVSGHSVLPAWFYICILCFGPWEHFWKLIWCLLINYNQFWGEYKWRDFSLRYMNNNLGYFSNCNWWTFYLTSEFQHHFSVDQTFSHIAYVWIRN